MRETLLMGQPALAHKAGEAAVPSGEGRWPRICERACASPQRRSQRAAGGRLTHVL